MREIKTENIPANKFNQYENHKMFYRSSDFRDVPVKDVISTRQLIADADTRDVLDLLGVPYREI